MPIAEFAPTPDVVGAILRTRTKDTNGNEIGTFNEDTRPSGVQVASLILQGAGDLALAVGSPDLPEILWDSARTVAAYRTGMLIELTYFPEQVALGRSPYPQLKELYDEALVALRAAYAVTVAESLSPEVPPGQAAYAFPTGQTPLDVLLGVPTTDVPWSGGLYQ